MYNDFKIVADLFVNWSPDLQLIILYLESMLINNHNFQTATVSSTLKALEVMGVDSGGGGGTVINMSSLLALNIGTHLPVYAATKTAVLQFSISMGVSRQNMLRV